MRLMRVLLLFSIFILQSIPITADSKSGILSGTGPKHISYCASTQCNFKCLPTKCDNEEILLWDPKRKIKPDVTLQCTEEYSCLGHIAIHGLHTIHHNHIGGTSKLYCNNARQRSCESTEFKFIDVDHQYIYGSISKSDIFFKNAESAHIVLRDDLESKPEQFFMNSVWTVNVKEFELIAEADYSAVGNVFDLSGVIKKSRIICKGKEACSGSLFIFSRCKMNDHKGNEIYCYNGACNDISVWVLHEKTDGYYCPQESEVHRAEEIVKVIAATNTKEKATEWQTQNVFIVTDVVEEEEGLKQLGLFLPEVQLKKPLDIVKVQGFQHLSEKKKKLLKNFAFRVSTFPSKELWVEHLAELVKDVFCKYREKYINSIYHSWIRTRFGSEAYGMQMVKVMTMRIQWGVMTQSLTALGMTVLGHAGFVASLGACAIPLIPMAIVWSGARVATKIGEWRHGKRFAIPDSKVKTAMNQKKQYEEDDEYEERVKEKCKDIPKENKGNEQSAADYNDFVDVYYYEDMLYDAGGDNFMNDVDDVQSVMGSDSDILGYDPSDEYQMAAHYVAIGAVFIVCWVLSILIAICGGAFGGFFLIKSKYRNHNDKTFTEIV